MKRCRIIFSGSGGQGIITAARILAETAVICEGLNAVQSQSYGPEARGGACRSDIIISDTDILFPKVTQPNILVCLTQEAYNIYSSQIRPGGLLLTDNFYVNQEKKVDAKQIGLAIYKIVMDTIRNSIVFNICMLGALIRFVPLVRPSSILQVLETRIPTQMFKVNQQALELGVQLAERYLLQNSLVSIDLW